MPIPTLRDYQHQIVVDLRAALRRSRRVLLASPTGSGKTCVFAWLACAVAEHGARIWIVAHRQEIVDQISAALTAFGVAHGFISAGRSETAVSVQVAMVATLARRLERHQGDLPDLLIIDEAHHATAATWRRIIDLLPEDALILGVTATPERLDGKPLSDIFRELVIGPSVADLVRDGWLAPAVHYGAKKALDLAGIRTRMGDYDQAALAERMSNDALIGDAVEHYRRLSPQLPGLVYCASIAHSMAVTEAFGAADYKAVHVDGDTPQAERQAAIAALGGGKIDLVCNVGLFSEGVDVPLLGIVLLLRPTQSLALYLQMVGRALRTGGGKRRAIILDHAGCWARHGLYDAPHAWALDGRRKDAGPLVRQCPACGAVIPIAAAACPECGHVFVRVLRPAAIPAVIKGDLDRIDNYDDHRLRVTTRGGRLRYRELLRLIAAVREPGARALFVERARRANGFRRGWVWRVLEEMAP
jgi:superfamily II DNA or RNA helicase